jgi:hypothetical protein
MTDDLLHIEVVVMGAHEFQFLPKFLHHHFSEYGVFSLQYAHFRPQFEEFAFFVVAHCEVRSAELEIAPNL